MHWTLGRRNYLLFRVWPPLDETCIPSRLPRIGCIVPAEMCSQLKGKICDAAEGIVQHHHRRLRSVVGWLFLELGTLDGDFLYLETNAYQFIGRWKVQSKGPAATHRRDWKGLTISLLVIVGQGENKEKSFLDLLGAKRKDEREKSCRVPTDYLTKHFGSHHSCELWSFIFNWPSIEGAFHTVQCCVAPNNNCPLWLLRSNSHKSIR